MNLFPISLLQITVSRRLFSPRDLTQKRGDGVLVLPCSIFFCYSSPSYVYEGCDETFLTRFNCPMSGNEIGHWFELEREFWELDGSDSRPSQLQISPFLDLQVFLRGVSMLAVCGLIGCRKHMQLRGFRLQGHLFQDCFHD